MRLARRTWIAIALAGALLASCVTPSIPIPPPEPEAMSFEVDPAAGTASFTFDPDPTYGGALVYLLNRDKGVGVIDTARADGSVGPTPPFEGETGDRVVVSFELDGELASTCVVLADGRSSSGNECDR